MEEVAGKLRAGERVSLEVLHEGLEAYIAFKNGWPPLYACLVDMPSETALVFRYCLLTDRTDETSLMEEAKEAAKAALWEKLAPGQPRPF